MTLTVMTMDEHGALTLPAAFTASSRATLRKLAQSNLKKMMASPEFPTDDRMQDALDAEGDVEDSVFDYAAHVRQVQAARAARRAARGGGSGDDA